MLYLTFPLMIMETIVQPCKAQKPQGEKNKGLADSFRELISQKHVNKSDYS